MDKGLAEAVALQPCAEALIAERACLMVLRGQAVEPEDIIVFEDSKNGIKAAKAAGMRVVGIRNEFMSEPDFQDADFLVDNYADIEI